MAVPSRTEDAEPGESSPGSDRPSKISGVRPKVEPEAPPPRSIRDLCLRNVSVRLLLPGTPDPVEFPVESGFGTHFFAAVSEDLTRGGLFVASSHLPLVGAPVGLAFDLPGGASVEARGTVCWVREEESSSAPRGFAIEFTDIDADALRRIAEFCAARPPMFFDFT